MRQKRHSKSASARKPVRPPKTSTARATARSRRGKKSAAPELNLDYQDLLGGFVRMHILHHAAEGDIYGQWMIDELAHHGYKMSAGTLYPMLHGMEQKGYLTSHELRTGRTFRRVYRATALGRQALVVVRARLDELFREVAEGDDPHSKAAEAAE